MVEGPRNPAFLRSVKCDVTCPSFFKRPNPNFAFLAPVGRHVMVSCAEESPEFELARSFSILGSGSECPNSDP